MRSSVLMIVLVYMLPLVSSQVSNISCSVAVKVWGAPFAPMMQLACTGVISADGRGGQGCEPVTDGAGLVWADCRLASISWFGLLHAAPRNTVTMTNSGAIVQLTGGLTCIMHLFRVQPRQCAGVLAYILTYKLKSCKYIVFPGSWASSNCVLRYNDNYTQTRRTAMGDKFELTVQDRNIIGKKVSKLREQGYVPAVMYGQDFVAKAIMAEEGPIVKIVFGVGRRQPVEVQLGSSKQLAMIKSTDFDPVKNKLRHVAFHVINRNEEVEAEVPVVIAGSGETPAEKAGLIVMSALETVKVKSLPANLPDRLEVLGEKLAEIDGHVSVSDIVVPKGVTILSEPDLAIATVYDPAALEAANEAAGGEAEPGEESQVASEEGGDKPESDQAEE